MTIISTTVVLVHLQIPFLPLAPANDPATQIRGWHEWAQDIDKIRNSVDPAHRIPVCANRYQETSLLGFFCKGHPKATSLCISDRKNGYPYFVDRLKQFSDTVMFVQTSSTPVNTPSYSSVFSVITPVGTVILTQGKQHIPYTVYKGKLQKPL